MVFAAVHLNQASVAAAITVALISGIKPPTTPAKTFQILHIEAGHLVSCFQSRSSRPEWKRGTEVAWQALIDKETDVEAENTRQTAARIRDLAQCDAVEPNLGAMWYRRRRE